MTTRDRVALTTEEAEAVFDILVEELGKWEEGRKAFVFHQTQEFVTEYRIGGMLGFGGKFWRYQSTNRPDGTWGEHWEVNGYPEDETPETLAAARAATTRLALVRERYEQRIAAQEGEQ